MAAKRKFSSTPASVIYAQSWPVPSSNSFSQRYPGKANSNSQKKSVNDSPWICKPKQQVTRPQKAVSPIHKSHSWASSMLSNNYPGWLEKDAHVMLDMAKEFKITLQMFKKLTEQVKEVDDQLNSARKPYSFKHYFKNSCNIRRPNTRKYTPEIPLTNEAYQPCNNLGFKREQRPPSQFGANRKTKKSNNTFKSKPETWSLSNPEKPKLRNWQQQEEVLGLENENTSTKLQNGDRINANLDYSDEEISWSSCLEFSDEDNHTGLGYIDPVPEDWEERKLEELEFEFCSERSGNDPFMVRYLQLRRLEIETVEQEKRTRKTDLETCESVPCLDFAVIKTTSNNKGKKSSNSKKQSSRMNDAVKDKGASENAERNPRRALKKSTQSASSLHDFEKFAEQKGAKFLNKETKDSRRENKDKKQTKIECSEKRTECKSAKGRKRINSCKGRPVSYSSSAKYDILELAVSFDPPSKERIKMNPRPVTAKSAKSKGMSPGKNWTSQRRFSLTAGQNLQSIPSDSSDPVISKARTTSAKKSSKRSAKRCSSSKL